MMNYEGNVLQKLKNTFSRFLEGHFSDTGGGALPKKNFQKKSTGAPLRHVVRFCSTFQFVYSQVVSSENSSRKMSQTHCLFWIFFCQN